MRPHAVCDMFNSLGIKPRKFDPRDKLQNLGAQTVHDPSNSDAIYPPPTIIIRFGKASK